MTIQPSLEDGATLELTAGGTVGFHYQLSGRPVPDGAVLELLTAQGWISGHYRDVLHPDTAAPAFEIHVTCHGGDIEHVRLYLPASAVLRWPAPGRDVSGIRPEAPAGG